jgi:hypothetical protein
MKLQHVFLIGLMILFSCQTNKSEQGNHEMGSFIR